MLMYTINIIDEWLTGADTESTIEECLIEYAHGRGGVMTAKVCHGIGELYTSMAADQDHIGLWRWFIEGMVCKKICVIQDMY